MSSINNVGKPRSILGLTTSSKVGEWLVSSIGKYDQFKIDDWIIREEASEQSILEFYLRGGWEEECGRQIYGNSGFSAVRSWREDLSGVIKTVLS